MAAPPVTVAVEPVVGGKLVYQPTAPLSPSGEPGARVMVELSITNTTGKAFTATSLVIDYASTTDPWTSTRTINMVVGPWSSLVWNPAQGIDGDLFTLSSIPTSATLSVFFTGYADPIKATYPLAAHVGPDKIGPYRFPSQAKDLALGEFWQVNGAGHNPGNHQSFAYDMGVWGTDHAKDAAYSELRTGGDAYAKKAPNSDYRIWGKPVRAMAEGEVIEIVNNCPSNTPLYPADPADMPGLMDGLKATYGAYVNGEGGNHVLIRHGDEVAMYAHMQPGSIDPSLKARKPAVGSKPAVPGSPVTPGQFLGLAGNSGRSSAPHLHIHSNQSPYPTGGTRPMLFTGAWSINNDTVAGVGYPPKLTGDPGGTLGAAERNRRPGRLQSAPAATCSCCRRGRRDGPRWCATAWKRTTTRPCSTTMAGKGMAPAWINTHTIQKGPTYFYTFFNVVFRPSLGRNEPTVHGVDRTGFESIRKDLVDKQGFHVDTARELLQHAARQAAVRGTLRQVRDDPAPQGPAHLPRQDLHRACPTRQRLDPGRVLTHQRQRRLRERHLVLLGSLGVSRRPGDQHGRTCHPRRPTEPVRCPQEQWAVPHLSEGLLPQGHHPILRDLDRRRPERPGENRTAAGHVRRRGHRATPAQPPPPFHQRLPARRRRRLRRHLRGLMGLVCGAGPHHRQVGDGAPSALAPPPNAELLHEEATTAHPSRTPTQPQMSR